MWEQTVLDLEWCAELLEQVADELGNPIGHLAQPEPFAFAVAQSKEMLSHLTQNIRDATRLGEVDVEAGTRHLAALDDILRPVLEGKVERPDELGLLYRRMARVFRELAMTQVQPSPPDNESAISEKPRNRP